MNRVHYVCSVPKEKALDDVEMAINAVDFSTSDYTLVNMPTNDGEEVHLLRVSPLADNPMNEMKTNMMIQSIMGR